MTQIKNGKRLILRIHQVKEVVLKQGYLIVLQMLLQQHPVSPQDKIAPGRRQRLQMILKRFPPDAAAPFPEFADAP